MCHFESGDSCRALTEKDCNGCGFKKTSQEHFDNQQKAVRRLKQLGIYEDCKAKYGLK